MGGELAFPSSWLFVKHVAASGSCTLGDLLQLYMKSSRELTAGNLAFKYCRAVLVSGILGLSKIISVATRTAKLVDCPTTSRMISEFN